MNDVFVHKTKRWKWQMEQICYFFSQATWQDQNLIRKCMGLNWKMDQFQEKYFLADKKWLINFGFFFLFQGIQLWGVSLCIKKILN